MADTGKYRNEVDAWRKESLHELIASFDKLNIVHRPASPSPYPARDILKAITAYRLGMPSKISFKFPRHMVFVHKGVGKGVPAGIAGTSATKRQPKEWFNPVIEARIDKLATIAAENVADYIVADIGIK